MLVLMLCMSAYIFSQEVKATNNGVDPPTVQAELADNLLRVEATPGFFPVEAIFINGRRFNFRVNSVLAIEVTDYVNQGSPISVYAIDFAGTQSATVWLYPPEPPPILVTPTFTPYGQGTITDQILDRYSNVEFFTISTAAGNIFHLIIDHESNNNNVHFLNAVTEWDLITLAENADLPIPNHIANPPPPPEPAPAPEPPPPVIEEEPPAQENDSRGAERFIFLAVLGVIAFGVIYYIKIIRPKQNAAQVEEEDEEGYGDFEDDDEEADEDEIDTIDTDENNESDEDDEVLIEIEDEEQ